MKRPVKRLPPYVMLLLDILLAGVILCVFAYFHHIRMLWGPGDATQAPVMTFAPPATSTPTGAVTPESTEHTHNWTAVETIDATCTEEGYTRYRCSVCGEESIDDRQAPLGHLHTERQGVLEATDESEGYTGDLVCTDCGAVLEQGQKTPATNHQNLRLINEKASTCTEQGYSGDWYCDDCEKIVTYGSPLPLAEHTYREKSVTPATCTKEGFTTYACAVCGAEKTGDVTPKTAHTQGKDGRCTACGLMLLDTSGEFGASFPTVFLQDSERLTLTGDDAIRAYAQAQGLSLPDDAMIDARAGDATLPAKTDGKYIALYRSHDIFLTILKVNTRLYFPGTGKSYTVQYYLYDIYIRNIDNLFTAYTTGSRVPMEDLMAEAEAEGADIVAAVNGDYMGNLNHALVCERNGYALRLPLRVESDVCVLYYDGTVETLTPAQYNRDAIAAKNPYQIWNFGPALIDENGKAVEEYSHDSYDNNIIDSRHPRTSFGYYEPGHYNFLVVDGRSDDSQGVRILQLAWLQEMYGAKAAYNMDGGDSTQAWYQDSTLRVDEDRGDDQRKLFDIICIGEVSP